MRQQAASIWKVFNRQRFLSRAKNRGVTEYLEQTVIAKLRKGYGEYFPEEETSLAISLGQIYAETGRRFVLMGLCNAGKAGGGGNAEGISA